MQTNLLFFRLRVIGIVLVLLVLTDLYAWRGLKNLLTKYTPRQVNRVKIVFFGTSVLVFILTCISAFYPELDKYRLLKISQITFTIVVLGAKATFCVFVAIADVQKLFRWIWGKVKPAKTPVTQINETVVPQNTITRGKFIYQAGLVVAAAPVYFFVKGVAKDAHNYKIHRIKLPAANLPDAFNGMKIVQVSDIHSGSFFDKDAVYKGVKMIVAEKPDVFFFTGDMVNVFAEEMNPWLDVFSPIKAQMGSYSILGNHDYGDYAAKWDNNAYPAEKAQNMLDLYAHHKNLGWQLLRNEHVVLDRMGQKLGIIGVENWGKIARFPKYGDIDKARLGMPDTPYKILLSHDPSHWDAKVKTEHKDINLTLSGHTHGFQFGVENKFIKFSPSQFIYDQWAGLYGQGTQHIYVNRGYGYIGYPGRVGILPEITVIELVKV